MKKVKFKGVTWMRPASVLFLLLISVGCSHNGNGTAGDVNTAGQVELCISAGGGAVSTRTAFNEGTPVGFLLMPAVRMLPERRLLPVRH